MMTGTLLQKAACAAAAVLCIALAAETAVGPPPVTTANGWDLYGYQKASLSGYGSTGWEYLNLYVVFAENGTFGAGEYDDLGTEIGFTSGTWEYASSSGKKVALAMDLDSLNALRSDLIAWAEEFDVFVDELDFTSVKLQGSFRWVRAFDEYVATYRGTIRYVAWDGTRARRGSLQAKAAGWEYFEL